ncbi:MAG: hypothetical protein IKA00_09595 [Prevotella sp.]|nr:hypothetical protein [Prevotella sp.]
MMKCRMWNVEKLKTLLYTGVLGTASASVGKAGTTAAVRAVKMTAQATGSYSKAALTSDAKLGWTKYAEENQINPAKEAAENAGGENAGV